MKRNVDDLERRCPKLGGPVHFGYCLIAETGRQPCPKIFDCWWERFDVVAHLRDRLPEGVFAGLACRPPANKVAGLVDLVRQAQERLKDDT